jgi:glycosyltransferase involved in cell wall biosynthesis
VNNLPHITVAIASVPTRTKLLRKAVWSVLNQTMPAEAVVVDIDHYRTGAAATKNRALNKATTEYTAILDDDDQFLPHHLERLWLTAFNTDADVVYSIPEVVGGAGMDVHGRYGQPFDPDELRRRSYIPTTSLFRTKLLQQAGGFQCPPGSNYDDWGCYLALLDAGAKFVHLPEVTWIWNHWSGNTSGQPDRW